MAISKSTISGRVMDKSPPKLLKSRSKFLSNKMNKNAEQC